MINIQLPTGTTIMMSAYDFFFGIEEKDIDIFYQSCIADNMGSFVEDPFSNRASSIVGIEIEEIQDNTINFVD